MRLFLLRHGMTEANERHLYCGRTDLPLSPAGEAALRQLRPQLQLPDNLTLYCSGMLRAAQTLAIYFPGAAYTVLPGLRETDFGAFEGKGYEELKDTAAYQGWLAADPERTAPPGGESPAQVLARAQQAVLPLIRQETDALCLTHGGVIAALLHAWFPHAGNRYVLTPRPGCGVQVQFCGGAPQSFAFFPNLEESAQKGIDK